MKIVRYLNDQDKTQFGVQHEDGSVTRIEGCIFSEPHDTGEPAVIKKALAPVRPAAVLCIGLNYRKHAEEGGASATSGVAAAGDEAQKQCILSRR